MGAIVLSGFRPLRRTFVVLARRPYGYFNVLAESGEEVNKAAYREVARAIAGQRRDMGLRNARGFSQLRSG